MDIVNDKAKEDVLVALVANKVDLESKRWSPITQTGHVEPRS